jgi:hypothetical protein
MGGPPPSIIVGRITKVGRTFVLVGDATRIELPSEPSFAGFKVGSSVTVRAVRIQGKYVAESIVLNPEPSP